MKKNVAPFVLLAASIAAQAAAQERRPADIPRQDHIFVVLMENHGYRQIINNPNEPFLNGLIAKGKVSLARNYFAVGHPSLTNYLEIVGGSNFGVRSDNPPNWGNANCVPNIQSRLVNADSTIPAPPGVQVDPDSAVCPIAGIGMDAATPAVDTWNEVAPGVFNFLADIDGVKSVPAARTVGETIADQLVRVHKNWKSYQETLPIGSVFGVNYSNGTATNLTNFATLAPLTSASVVQAYAVKHNPFAYFKNVQDGNGDDNSLANVVGFDGARGFYADLASGDVPNLAFVVPNQCNDQHGRGNGDAFCGFDPGVAPGDLTAGTQAGLNPGLIQQGDATLERIVGAIHDSRVWHEGRSAIVIVWDENDYSGVLNATNGIFPPQNQNSVVLTVETNAHDFKAVSSSNYYTSFSLLKSLEAAFDLPCLNHACDPGVSVMTDLFGHDGR